MFHFTLRIFAISTLLGCSLAVAQRVESQTFVEQTGAKSGPAVGQTSSCNPWKTKILPEQLSFRERSCMQLAQLTSPGLLATSVLMAGFSEVRDHGHSRDAAAEDAARHLGNLYARRTVRASAELLVSQLHNEDLRYHPSNAQTNWERTKAAFVSVLRTTDADGGHRIALAPLAGAFGSGMTSLALAERHNGLDDAFRRSGIIYSHYFVSAVIKEFSPELLSLASSFRRKHK